MRLPGFSATLIGGVGALVLAGIVVTLIAARQPEPVYPPHSPAGAVSAYLRLLQDGQVDKAYALTSTGMAVDQFHQQFDAWSQQSHRVTLVRATTNGDEATVTVDITTFSAGPFGASDATDRQTFTLLRLDKVWSITGPDYWY